MAGSPLTTKAAAPSTVPKAVPKAAAPTPSPEAGAAASKEGRPGLVTGSLVLMAASGFVGIGLGVYFIVWGGNFFGGLLEFFLGFVYAYGARALHKGESWGWGAGVFGGALFVLFGILLLPYAAITMALGVVVMILMIAARKHYGLVRHDPKEEERRRGELKALRTRNPLGIRCPHCGSTALWLSPDGSAFCGACKKGTISIRRTA